jgi:hypothetical protein
MMKKKKEVHFQFQFKCCMPQVFKRTVFYITKDVTWNMLQI